MVLDLLVLVLCRLYFVLIVCLGHGGLMVSRQVYGIMQ